MFDANMSGVSERLDVVGICNNDECLELLNKAMDGGGLCPCSTRDAGRVIMKS